MSFSIQATIRALAAPNHRLSIAARLWAEGLRELARRGEGLHESGAFILGTIKGQRRRAECFVYYDDLEPHALATGIVTFDGSGYGRLWQLCRETGLDVIADVHTHGDVAKQSSTDRVNPMVATPGHIALIVPNLAQRPVKSRDLGIYEYMGQYRWKEYTGPAAARYFYIGVWG